MSGCNMTKREPLQKPVLPQVNYMELLNEELASCCRPSIKDVSKASADDIMRDIYRVLSGDQDNVTGGLIVKVASANVNIGILQKHVASVTTAVNDQLDRCNEVQADNEQRRVVDKVKNDMIRGVLGFVWDNRTVLSTVVVAVALYINSMMAVKTSKDETAELIKQLDTKVLVIAKSQHTPTQNQISPPASRTP